MMEVSNDSLYLYHLTLKKNSYYLATRAGNFLGNRKSQELLLVTPTSIELWKVDPDTGKISRIYQENVFSVIISVEKVRSLGSKKDLVVLTSDSGKISILEFSVEKERFIPVIQEPFSKNGLRRISPGEYLCVDPMGRAIMLGALEKNKLLYKVLGDDTGKIDMSSPLTSTSRQTLTLNLCALDEGFEDPIFAAIECEIEDAITPDSSPRLQLNYYMFDQGINYISRTTYIDNLPDTASHLVAMPSFVGGVLICCSNVIIYMSREKNKKFIPIPLRESCSEVTIINHVMHKLKKNNFFILLQSDVGDCYKLAVDYDEEEDKLQEIFISYFDTIPVCVDIAILKSGFLFANVLNNNRLFYQFEKLGDAENLTTLSSSNFSDFESCQSFSGKSRYFKVTGLQNLALVDVIETLNPITDATLVDTFFPNISDPFKQILTISSHSYLKSLTHGVATDTIVSSTLPLYPTSIQTTKLFADSVNDDYLVLSSSLSSQTLVLSIGEVVEEVTDSYFISDRPTLLTQQVGISSIVQVYPDGIRHIRHTRHDNIIAKKTTDWHPPAGITIVKASANNEQVIIGLSNRELCYFEIDPVDDQLVEYQARLEMTGGSISAVAIGSYDAVKSRKKSSYAIIGCTDETIHVVSLKPQNCFEIVTMQALSSNSSSIFLFLSTHSSSVHIGMDNGLYVRVTLDEITGKFSDTRIRFLGSRAVKLCEIDLPSSKVRAILAISSRSWIICDSDGSSSLVPLLDLNIGYGASFYSEEMGGSAIVGVEENNLIIFTIDENVRLNDFTIRDIKLRFQPRRLVVTNFGEKGPGNKLIFLIESEYGIKSPYCNDVQKLEEEGSHTVNGIDEDYYDAFGFERKSLNWASCIQVIDDNQGSIIFTREIEDNESAISICAISFQKNLDRPSHIIVGATRDRSFLPNSFSGNFIYTFKINSHNHLDANKQPVLELCHKTEIDFPPTALVSFNGRLLVGMKNYVRLYDLGQKQLLRKSSSQINFLNSIVQVTHLGGERIAIGDSKMSISYLKFDSVENRFISFASDVMKRQMTCMTDLDFDTSIGGDKFGNVFVVRVPNDVSSQSEKEWTLLKNREPYLNASFSRLERVCDFYIQDIPTSFTKGTLVMGGKESIIYTGIQGTIGMLLPLTTKLEVAFFEKLQDLLRSYFSYNFDDFDQEKNGYNLLGKDHLKFRGYYNPQKNVIDGDLIEKYSEVKMSMKVKMGRILNKTPKEIEKKITDIRSRSCY